MIQSLYGQKGGREGARISGFFLLCGHLSNMGGSIDPGRVKQIFNID